MHLGMLMLCLHPTITRLGCWSRGEIRLQLGLSINMDTMER